MAKLTGKQHAFVAAYLGKARYNATEAARIAGYKKPAEQGYENLRKPHLVQAIAEWREEAKTEAILEHRQRLERLGDLERRYAQLIAERAEDMEDEDVPGGATGLLVRQRKMLGGGEHGYEITEYVADTAVTKEIRELLKQSAQERGEWTDKHEVNLDVRSAAERVAADLQLPVEVVLSETARMVEEESG